MAKLFFAISSLIVAMFSVVDDSPVGQLNDNTNLAHQMPFADAVHHITGEMLVIDGGMPMRLV